MEIVKIVPHGFCAGVIGALKKALSLEGTVYCLHELVHNEIVVADLKARGFVFVERVEEVPEGSTVLFSAHGVSPAVRQAARARNLKVVDATCPFVQRVHDEARRYTEQGKFVYVIGKRDHVEVQGILGEIKNRQEPLPYRIAVVSQTTMNSDEVAARIEELRRTHEVETSAQVCNATRLRQDAVRNFTGDALLVLGSANSSNTRELGEVARCAKVFRAGTIEEVKALDLSGVKVLGVTSGASTPESFYEEAINVLADR